MTDKARPSHKPLLAILGGIAVVAAAFCGGGVYLLARSVREIQRTVEARRGPVEVVDDALRLRVTLPTDGDPSWEIWGGELALGWDPDAVVVLRNDACEAALLAQPLSARRTLSEQLEGMFEDTPSTPCAAPAGADGDARTLTVESGFTVVAFAHAGTLHRALGDEPCVSTLVERIEILDANVRPRRLRPAVASRDSRGYEVRDDIFTSAATGLRVDARPPLSLELDDAHPGAEVVVVHDNGSRIALDPRRTLLPLDGPESAGDLVVPMFGRDTRFVPDPEGFVAVVPSGAALGVRLFASGVDRERVEEALGALASRVSLLARDELAALRRSIPAPSDRRAGLDWSLRDGVFREHPSEARPRAVLRVPPLAEVLAGSELASLDFSEGSVIRVDRRDLGVVARLFVRAIESTDAREELRRVTAGRGEIRGNASRASVETPLDANGPLPWTRHAELVLEGGWAFELDVEWHSLESHEETPSYVDELVRGFTVEPAEPDSLARESRLGFSISDAGGVARALETSEAAAEASAGLVWEGAHGASVTVVAVSDPRVASTRTEALDLLDFRRTVAAFDARSAAAATLDGRAAMMRSFGTTGRATRVLETRIDRTTYVVVVRGAHASDWQTELARVDLDP